MLSLQIFIYFEGETNFGEEIDATTYRTETEPVTKVVKAEMVKCWHESLQHKSELQTIYSRLLGGIAFELVVNKLETNTHNNICSLPTKNCVGYCC